MKILYVVMFYCFSAVRSEASAVLEASGSVGADVSIHCAGGWKTNSSEHYNMYFCKGVCSRENILVQTERKRASAQRGRYSMEVSRDGAFNVTIRRLQPADAGTYHCGVEKTFNVLHQQVNLMVTDASTAALGPAPSTASLQAQAQTQPQGHSAASTRPPPAAPARPEDGTKQPAAARLRDTTLVIIVSVSLALLVCAIIPLIFYGHCRSHAGGQNKEESDYCEGSADVGSSHTEVRLQALEADVDPESRSPSAAQYAAVYQALNPRTLD